MQVKDKDTKPAPNKWWAAHDAAQRNTRNKPNWPGAVRDRVERMKVVLEILYWGKIYEAYGKKQVTIKVEGARAKDRAKLERIEQDWAEQGITKTVTPQGVLYRVA